MPHARRIDALNYRSPPTFMNWKHLTQLEQLDAIVQASHNRPQVIFKHSTRCSISILAKNRLDAADSPVQSDFYYLDLLAHRDISNQIAAYFNIQHESPQVLIIKAGTCVYDETHSAINMGEMLPFLQ